MVNERIGTVLVVDDDVENIDILSSLLEEEYGVCVARDGASALAVACEQHPTLILLDILMPDMNGYEVCRTLKENMVTRDIPVIFLSSLSDEDDQEEGLLLGAVDYITKPFSPCLVRARVHNHVILRRAQLDAADQMDAIQDSYQRLREIETQRDDMAHMLVHDLRTPLTSMLAGLDHSLFRLKAAGQTVPEVEEILSIVKRTGRKLNGMLTTLLDVGRLESGTMPLSVRHCRVADVIHSALQGIQGLTKCHRITVTCMEDEVITCDQAILERIITNLFLNSLQHTPEQGDIVLTVSSEQNWVRITVADTGPGILPEFHEKIFQKFGRVTVPDSERGSSAGLGLTFCKLAVEAHGGSIHVDSTPGEGACFSIRFPQEFGSCVGSAPGISVPTGSAADLMRGSVIRANITVFLISNDRMLLKSLKRYLETCTSWSVTAFHDLARAVRTALIVRPDIVLLDIDMQHACDTDIFRDLESVVAARKSTVAYYTELLLPEETGEAGYSLAKGGQSVIPKRLPLASFLDILIKMVRDRNQWLQRK
ncbi:MAG: response regulator [Desulfobulbus sp.]|nr:response regulator [Desulfobulbus sp.]